MKFRHFTLRDLFWLTVVVAMGLAGFVAWFSETASHDQTRRRLAEAADDGKALVYSEMKRELEELGYTIHDGNGMYMVIKPHSP